MARQRAVAIVAAVAVLVIGIAWGAHNALALGVVRAIASGYGYNIAFQRFDVGWNRAKLVGPSVVNKAGEPVFTARQIDLADSLRDLLPGGKSRFGLRSVDVEQAQITLIHHPDGTYNVKPLSIAGAKKQQAAPFNMRVRVRGGSVAMIDAYTAY